MGYRHRYDEETVEETVERLRVVTARKARGDIRPGDLVRVSDGFTYEVGGRRTGYLPRRSVVLVSADGSRVHGYYIGWVLREHGHRLSAVQREAAEAFVAAREEKARVEREAAEART